MRELMPRPARILDFLGLNGLKSAEISLEGQPPTAVQSRHDAPPDILLTLSRPDFQPGIRIDEVEVSKQDLRRLAFPDAGQEAREEDLLDPIQDLSPDVLQAALPLRFAKMQRPAQRPVARAPKPVTAPPTTFTPTNILIDNDTFEFNTFGKA